MSRSVGVVGEFIFPTCELKIDILPNDTNDVQKVHQINFKRNFICNPEQILFL